MPADPKPIRPPKEKPRFLKRKTKKVRKNRVKRVKLPSFKSLKARAWSLFSEFIRKRDSINGMVACCSCSKLIPYKESQAGHFIPGRMFSVLFHERLTHGQCAPCNIWKHGNLYQYGKFMLARYGKEEVEKMEQEAKKVVKFTRSDLEAIIAKYST